MPVLGADALLPIGQAPEGQAEKRLLFCEIKGLKATGHLTPNGLVVLTGSQAVLKERASAHQWPYTLATRNKLIEDGTLVQDGDHLKFTRDAEFSSPSAGRLLGIMHVARAVLEPQDVARLRDVGHERVVAEILTVMGIEASEGPGHGGAGADDRPVDIEGQAGHGEARQSLEHELLVELDQRPERCVREPAQPIGNRARRRHPRQPAEPADERVADEILQVLYPPRPDVHQREQQQTQPGPAVVAPEVGARAAQSGIQVQPTGRSATLATRASRRSS